MKEIGESSLSSRSNSSKTDAWAKLVPSDPTCSDFELMSDETVIFSQINISLSQKSEWCKITRNMDLVTATVENMSGKAILVDGMVILNKDTAIIQCGSEIIPAADSSDEGLLSYKLKVLPAPESRKKLLKISLDAEHAQCCICLNIWHDVVTVAPCLHNFCNGCFSEWLRKSLEKHSSVLCPECRTVVQFVGRNHFLHGIEEDLLLADNSLKRSTEEIAVLDSHASIKSPLVINCGNKSSHKRARSSRDGENNGDLPCAQCGTELAGYQCSENTVHLQCHACGGMMPSRTNIGVPQHCLGCDRAFCGAYWYSQGVTGTASHLVCSPETFKPISERSITRIPFWVHEKNRHEQDITESCIRRMGKTLQDVITEWIRKFNNRGIDRTRMPLNHAEMITCQTHTCLDCYGKFVSFLLYWFRVTTPNDLLPPEASQRGDCWYGYACRTQHHNEEHARKRNHVCRPTRASHM